MSKKTSKRKKNAGNSVLLPGTPAFRKWRDNLNPFRGLTIRKAVGLLEAAARGEMADYQWTCRQMERRFPALSALVARRTSAVVQMDWDIRRVMADEGDKAMEKLAGDQANKLREVYEGISNIYEAVETLQMAVFRGFALCEKIRNADGDLVELRPVPQWNLVRDGSRMRWKYNPDARSQSFDTMQGDELPLERFLVRDVDRPINEIALILFLRENAANKNHDAFLEIYGVPGGVVILPPDVPPDKADEYREAARKIAEGGSGSLPHGSQYEANDGPRGTNPFDDYRKAVHEQLVLAGTGGKLTMLAESGSGTLAGSAHADTFREIAASDARDISEIFQKQLDAEVLEEFFPGAPRLAYFELNFREEVDAKEVVAVVSKLSSAGFRCDAAEISEKVGLKLRDKGEPEDRGQRTEDRGRKPEDEDRLENRAGGEPENPQFTERAKKLRAALPRILGEMGGAPELAALLEELLASSFVAGAAVGGTLENSRGHNPYRDPVSGLFTSGPSLAADKDAGGGGELRETRVPVSDDVFSALGIEKGNVFADYGHLAAKHPEYFRDSFEARDYVEHVFERPDYILPGNQPDHRLIVRSERAHRAVALEVQLRGGKYRVRSAHTLTDTQLSGKIKRSAGQVVRLGNSRVNPGNRETPSRRLGDPHGKPPAVIERIIQTMEKVK